MHPKKPKAKKMSPSVKFYYFKHVFVVPKSTGTVKVVVKKFRNSCRRFFKTQSIFIGDLCPLWILNSLLKCLIKPESYLRRYIARKATYILLVVLYKAPAAKRIQETVKFK